MLPEEAIEAIKELEDRYGRLTPEQVVDEAKDAKSPLHQFFDWDDSSAALSWRIEQARELIRRVKIEVVYEDRPVRVVRYVRDPRCNSSDCGYVALLKVARPDASAVMLAELNQIASLVDRALRLAQAQEKHLPGLAEQIAGLANQIEEVKKGI
jgi:hypothetical protein